MNHTGSRFRGLSAETLGSQRLASKRKIYKELKSAPYESTLVSPINRTANSFIIVITFSISITGEDFS